MAKKILFLQLSPEFGSTKFGPFTGAEIRLGNDPGRNDIVLPENLGVSVEHCRVVKQQGDETFIVAPVDRTSLVFVWRKDGRPPKQITAPQALTDGDGFSLGAAEGPRFIIVLEYPKAAGGPSDDGGPKAGIGKAASKLSSKGLLDEIKRRGFAKAVSSSLGHGAVNAWTFIKSGAFLQPRYIIIGLMLVSGYLFAGTMSCGLAASVYDGQSKAETITKLKDECGVTDVEEGPPSINKQTAKIMGPAGADFKSILDKDPDLAALYTKKLASIKGNAAQYDWVRAKGQTPLSQWQAYLAKSTSYYDPALVRVFTYLAATPNDPKDYQLFRIFENPEKGFSCYRGPLQLSWRQADRFGMSNLFLDVPVDIVVAGQGARDEIQPLLEAEPAKVGEIITLGADDEIVLDPIVQQENLECMYVKGDDDRDKVNDLPGNLKELLGKKGKGLPGPDAKGNYILNRMFKYYAADWQRGYKDAKFDDPKKTLTAQLDATSSAQDDAKAKTMDQVAELMARAAIIPCLGIIGNDEAPQWMLDDASVKNDSKWDCAGFLFLIDESAARR